MAITSDGEINLQSTVIQHLHVKRGFTGSFFQSSISKNSSSTFRIMESLWEIL